MQFDLTFEVAAGGTRLALVPLPDNLPVATDDRGWPPGRIRTGAARGRARHDVDRIRIQRLSVQAEPLGPVLRQLAARLGLELRIDEKALQAAGISLDQRVTVKVENATVDELFRRLLESTGLKCRRHQKVVGNRPRRIAFSIECLVSHDESRYRPGTAEVGLLLRDAPDRQRPVDGVERPRPARLGTRQRDPLQGPEGRNGLDGLSEASQPWTIARARPAGGDRQAGGGSIAAAARL